MLYNVSVNFIAVVVATVAAMIIGYLWYSPMLFGNMWQKLLGKKDMGSKADMPMMMAKAFVTVLIMAYVLAYTFKLVNATSLMDALGGSFWIWLGFIATTQYTNSLFTNTPKKLFLIDTGHHLVVMLIMGAIIFTMG